MDALDALILRELGMEPFIAWPRRNVGLRLSDVARRLGRNLQFVKDRVARMEDEGVITGYRLFPNLRHLGLSFSVHRWPASFVPDGRKLSRLATVDGFVGVVWCLDDSLCLEFAHADAAERDRRLELIADLLGLNEPPATYYQRTFPHVARRLSPLDWRIVQALEPDARRPLTHVAQDVGVTARTVRTRFEAMWTEGSVDQYVTLDFAKVSGIIPFQMAIWYAPDASDPAPKILKHFHDRYLAHFHPPPGGYASLLLRIFAYTPAEVQALLRETMALEGVERAEPSLATGSFHNQRWLPELLARQTATETVRLP